nr:hypothetical protein GCM10020241_18500 [Streptoalloteichus tenebrarius]
MRPNVVRVTSGPVYGPVGPTNLSAPAPRFRCGGGAAPARAWEGGATGAGAGPCASAAVAPPTPAGGPRTPQTPAWLRIQSRNAATLV